MSLFAGNGLNHTATTRSEFNGTQDEIGDTGKNQAQFEAYIHAAIDQTT
jgi:hypothetical protein